MLEFFERYTKQESWSLLLILMEWHPSLYKKATLYTTLILKKFSDAIPFYGWQTNTDQPCA